MGQWRDRRGPAACMSRWPLIPVEPAGWVLSGPTQGWTWVTEGGKAEWGGGSH